MKLKKLTALFLSLALTSASVVSLVSAAELMPTDPKVDIKAEVTATDEYGPIITVTVDSENFADPVMSGRNVGSVFGAAAVEVVLKLSDKFSTSSVSNAYWFESDSAAGTYTIAGQADNKVYVSWGNATASKYITNDSMKLVFAVDDADGVVNTVEEYNDEMGTVESIFVTVKQYADAALKYETYVGTSSDCKYAANSVVVGTPTATPESTATPTAEPTATPTAEPTATPTAEPTATPTAEPTATPTAEPTATPTAEPADKVTVDETATAVADDTAYWGVKILEAAEANITAKFETDTESKEVTLVNAAGLDGNGDLAFNLYLKLTGERVGKAVTATVTVGDDSDSGVWAAAN